MLGVKIVVALLLLMACAIFSVYWNAAVQPDVGNAEAMRQLEIHTDGMGDRLANERRVVTTTYRWPIVGLDVFSTLIIVALFWSDARKLFASNSKETKL